MVEPQSKSMLSDDMKGKNKMGDPRDNDDEEDEIEEQLEEYREILDDLGNHAVRRNNRLCVLQ